MVHVAALVAHTDAAAQLDIMALVVNTEIPARPIPAKIVGHAAVLVVCTDVVVQQDTEVPVVNTELEIFGSMHKEGLVSQMKMDG